MSRKDAVNSHDLKSLVKLVLTRAERHELRDLTELKRSGDIDAPGRIRLRELKDKVAFAALANNAPSTFSYTVEDNSRTRAKSNPNMKAYNKGRESPGYRPGPSDDANGFYNNDSNEDSDENVGSRKPRPPPKTPRTSFNAPTDHSRFYSMLNKAVKKNFGHHGIFIGSVTSLVDVPGHPTPFFKIKYEDGDVEDVDYEELLKILVKDKEPSRKKPEKKEPVVEPVVEKAKPARALSPELVSFHKVAPPVTVDEGRSRALTTDAVFPLEKVDKELPGGVEEQNVNSEPVRRETTDGVLGKASNKVSSQPKWKLASASTLSNKLNSHNQSRNTSPRIATSIPRANSGIAARWLSAAKNSDSEAERVVLTDTDKGLSSADERRRPVSKKMEIPTEKTQEAKLSPKRPSQKDRDLEPLSPIRQERRSSLKEPNSPKLGPKRKLSWRLNKESDSEAAKGTNQSRDLSPKQRRERKEEAKKDDPSSPLSPTEPKRSPRSPKLNRWDVDALKKQAKDAELKVAEMSIKHRNVILKATIGRLRKYKCAAAFRQWCRLAMSSLMSSVKQLASQGHVSRSEGAGAVDEELLLAQEHIQKYESQMAQLRERLAEAENSLRHQADERARRVTALVKERARAVTEEDFEKALALHHQISALNISGQLADDNVKISSPVRNGVSKEESLLGSIAGLATLTLSPVTAITTMRMVTTPKSKSSTAKESRDSDIQVERLGNHGSVIAPADSKLISKPSGTRSHSVPPKLITKSSSSASWIAKEVEEKPVEPVKKPTKRVARSSSILERAANFSKKPEEERDKSATRGGSVKRAMGAKTSLTVRVNSKEGNSDSDGWVGRQRDSSDEVMKKLKSVVVQDQARKVSVTDSDDELWMKKLSPEKAALLKGCDNNKPPPPPSPLAKKPDSPRAPKWSEKTNSLKSNPVPTPSEAKVVPNGKGSQSKVSTPVSGAKRTQSQSNIDRAEAKRGISREGSVKKVPSTQRDSDSDVVSAEPKNVSPSKGITKKKSSISQLFSAVHSSDQDDTTNKVEPVPDNKLKPTEPPSEPDSPSKSGKISGIGKLFNSMNETDKDPKSTSSSSPLKRGKVFGNSPKKQFGNTEKMTEVPVEESVPSKVFPTAQSSNKFPAKLTSKPTVGRDLPPVASISGTAQTVYAEMTKSMKPRSSKSVHNSMKHYGEWSGVGEGDKCWVSDPHNAYLPATIEEVISESELKVLTEGDRPLSFIVDLEQKEIKVDKRIKSKVELRRLLPREHNETKEYEDMDELPHLHEASILHNVDVRFREDKIYTNTGPILIAMNPFKWLPIYDDDVMRQYLNRPRGALPPHCFAEAEASFQALNASKQDQAIIICGDSGAGKTETTKLMLSYLSFVSETRYQGERPEGTTMAERLVESSPLLEALGNAKTLKNTNSSRFSKLSALQFSESSMGIGQIEGATLSNLLLESSRVSFQPTGERNYHIFYQLLESSLKFRKLHGLECLNEFTAESVCYTNHSGCINIPTIDDADDFESTVASMCAVQINLEDRTQILRIVSAVLILGNVKFEEGKGEDDSSVVTKDTKRHLEVVANLLGIDGGADKLADALVVQIRELPGGNSLRCGQTASKSASLRDALAKAIYFRLFHWVAQAINKSLKSGKKVSRVIGILDIFGFEDMTYNSFEQLLINTTNELLQTLFNENIFQAESEEYLREGISWDETTFPDNTPTMLLLERKPLGLLPYLDSECSRGNAASDGEALVRSFNKNHGDKNVKYVVCGPSTSQRRNDKSRTRDEDFLVKHYAGDVVYTVQGFIAKNRDELFSHVQDLMKTSTSSIKLFKADEDQSKSRTVTSKFLNQLSDLRGMLSESQPRFVRCIKSNDNHSPQEVNRISVLRQLVCGGVIAALEVRKAGFPNKMAYKDFVNEFRVFTPTKGNTFKGDDEALALNMFLHPRVRERIPVSAIRPGKTKLFMQADVLYQLRFLKDYEIYPFVCRIQRWWEAAQGDRTQRLVLRCHKAIHNAMDKASMNGVQFNEDVDHAIENALELLDLAEEVAGVAKVVGKRKLNETNVHTIENVKEAVLELEALVETAVREKEEATKARAEVLGNLDSHCNRLSYVFSVAETLLNEHARMTLIKTAKNAELQLHAVRQEYMLAGTENKHTVSHNFRGSTARQSSRRIKKESTVQMRKLVSRLKSALERKDTQDKKASGRMKKKRGAVGSASMAFGFDNTSDGAIKMDQVQLRKVFDVVDLDKSGEIDAEELSAIMQEMSVDVAIADQAAQLVRKVNEDEVISYDQFVEVMTEDSDIGGEFRETFARLKDRIEKIGDWKKQFESVDADHSGGIDPAELSLAMGEMGDDPISEAEARCLIEFANSNNTGTISMQDFVKMMTQVERFAGGEAARAAHLAKAFELVRHAEDLEFRYSEDNTKLVRARDAYRDGIIANEERLLAHDITKFQDVGITAVSGVFLVARGALDTADEALRGVDSEALLRACEDATKAVDAALEVMEREERRISLLEKCKATEEKVVSIRTKATSGATEGLLETSTDLSASLREAESTLAKFNEMRFGRSTGPSGEKERASMTDAALLMDLDELQLKVDALVKEADDCEEFQNKAIAAMKQERLDRLNNIRNKFESGGKTSQGGKLKGLVGRARAKTTLS